MSTFSDGSESAWQGKNVMIWKKVDEEWKMYLDIWNSSLKRH
jgi:ketosteroid isomerase-like protein